MVGLWFVANQILNVGHELEKLAVQETRRHPVAARHFLDQRFGEPHSAVVLGGPNEPRAAQTGNVIRDAAFTLFEERLYRRPPGVVAEQHLDDFHHGGFAVVATGPVEDEHGLVAGDVR